MCAIILHVRKRYSSNRAKRTRKWEQNGVCSMAIKGAKPWEIARGLLKRWTITQSMVVNHTTLSPGLVGKMVTENSYTDGLINKRFLEFLEFFGYDIKITLVANENLGTITDKLDGAEVMHRARIVHRERMKLEERTVRRLKEEQKRLEEEAFRKMEEAKVKKKQKKYVSAEKQAFLADQREEMEIIRNMKKEMNAERRAELRRVGMKASRRGTIRMKDAIELYETIKANRKENQEGSDMG